MKRFLSIILILTMLALLISCDGDKSEINGEESAGAEVNTDFETTPSEMFTDRDYSDSYNSDDCAYITLNGSTASSSTAGVSIDGGTVTILDGGTYVISGVLDDGMIIVNAAEDDKPHIIFDGVNVTSKSSAALYVLECDKLVITLNAGSENSLSSGESFVAIDENNIDATVFSKQDISFNGEGTLCVSSPAGHGIVSKDDLVFTGGKYTVSAVSHGIDANDSIRIDSAEFSVSSGKDALHAENSDDSSLGYIYILDCTLTANAYGDGIDSGAYVQIDGGKFDITTQSGSSADSQKGIKAASTVLIKNGDFKITSYDDAIHSNTSIVVNGGNYEIATSDDAFHADETLEITSGVINITGSYEGLEGLDIAVSGGDITIIASDDGINAAGGNDQSGFGGSFGPGDKFGGGRPGGPGGGGFGTSSSGSGSITISGGKIYMNASGDGIDANGSLTITGGEITVCGPTSGDTSVLDYDNSATISGGTFIGTGANMMAQTFSSSAQGVIALTVGNRTAGTLITVSDTSGNVIVSYSPKLSYQIVIISTPELKKGTTYKISIGDSTGEFEAS